MRKTVLLIVIFLLIFNGLVAQEGVVFSELSWKENIAKAEVEDKLIFIDAYADWCGPCKWMAANAFMDEEVAAFMNKTFICVQIDMESEFGNKFDLIYDISAYPTLLFIDSKGDIVKRSVGALTAEQLLSLAKRVDDPTLSLAYNLKVKYDAGDHSQELMEEYLEAVDDEGVDADTVIVEMYNDLLLKFYNNDKSIENQEKLLEFTLFNDVEVDSVIIYDYIGKIKGEDLTEVLPFIVFIYYVNDIQDPLVVYFAQNYNDIYEKYDKYASDKVISIVADAIIDYKSGKIKRKVIYNFVKELADNDEEYQEFKTIVDELIEEE